MTTETTRSIREIALGEAVGLCHAKLFTKAEEVVDAAQQFLSFLEGRDSPKAAASDATPAADPVTSASVSTATGTQATRAEDRVPKDPPKRTSRQVGKPAPAAASAAETTTATTASPSKPLTLDDVRAQLVLVQTKAGNKDAVFALIKKHSKDGTHTLSALEQPKFGNVIADAKAYLAS